MVIDAAITAIPKGRRGLQLEMKSNGAIFNYGARVRHLLFLGIRYPGLPGTDVLVSASIIHQVAFLLLLPSYYVCR